MKAKHHFWSSLAAGGALYWATGSSLALAGSMVGGFLIDADHIIDQLWSIRQGAPLNRKPAEDDAANWAAGSARDLWMRLVRRRKLIRMPLIFHSYELLLVITVLTLTRPTAFLIGLLTGYVLHLVLDMIRHYHEFNSPFFYLFSYRLAKSFRRSDLIRSEFL